MDLRIRLAQLGDTDRILNLVEQYWACEGIVPFAREQLRAPLLSLLSEPKSGHGIIAALGTELAGYLLLVYVFSLEHRGITAEIDELFVAPQFRGLGVASGLVDFAIEQALNAGVGNLSLQLGRSNDRARAFYARHGFVPRAGYELLEKQLGA